MDINKLKGLIPDTVLMQIPGVIDKFSINTPLRLAHFISQCAHESGNFKATTEHLEWYTAAALMKTWPKRFPEALAKECAKNAEKIANVAYANRMGNGPPESGDGYKYRGRGYIQLTGKVNYTAFCKYVTPDDVVATPDLVATKYPLLSAAWFWNNNALNKKADKGSTDAVVSEITQIINGGQNGYDDRLAKFKKFYPLLAS